MKKNLLLFVAGAMIFATACDTKKVEEIKEVVEENTYIISPKSFWQSHKNAPRLLLQQVIKYADIKGEYSFSKKK